MNLPNIMIIGLTGNSGAGKSTVRDVFQSRGFTVIDCDNSARSAADNHLFLSELNSRFSHNLLNPDGTLNRPLTAKIIYADSGLRSLYNRIIFPYIIYDVIEKVKSAPGDVLLDAPTLFEANLNVICGAVVSVTADLELCRSRIMRRDHLTEEQAAARLSSQHSAEYFRERSDFTIENNSTIERLFESAHSMIDKLKGTK